MFATNISTQRNSECNKIYLEPLSEQTNLLINDEDNKLPSFINITNYNIDNKSQRKYKSKFYHWKQKRHLDKAKKINKAKEKDVGLCRIKYKKSCKVSNFTHCTNKKGSKSFDWNLIKQLFEIENNDTLSTLFSFGITLNKPEAQIEILKINDADNNDNRIPEENYTLCKIKSNKKSNYLLYDMGNTPSKSKSNFSFGHNIPKDTFTSRKENNNDSNSIDDEMKDVYSTIPKFKTAFRLNSLSKKLLSLEKSVNTLMKIDADNSYLSNQLISKREILQVIIKNNLLLTQTIGLNSKNEAVTKKDIAELFKEQKKIKNILTYKTIYKRLTEGLQDKTYSELISVVNPLRLKQGNPQQEIIKKYYETKSECCVCLSYCPYSSTHIAYCRKCNIGIHTNCYGLIETPILFDCDLCLALNKITSSNSKSKSKDKNTKLINAKCIFCLQSYGALKKINRNANWGHVTCVLLSSYAHFSDYLKLDNILWIDSLEETILLTHSEKCDICNNTDGEKFSCVSCGRQYHFFCAYFKGYKLELKHNTSTPVRNSVTVQIKQCSFESSFNIDERNDQSYLRHLIYHKKKSL